MTKTSPTASNISKNAPHDLNGAEQHHDLKNQTGAQGDKDHAKGAAASNKLSKAVQDADEDTAVAAALKDAAKK